MNDNGTNASDVDGPAPTADGEAVAFYYGDGRLDRLARYRRIVLQADFYSAEDIGRLRGQGVQPLAYLSLTEDPGPAAPWQRTERNPDWGGAFVHVGHPDWVEHVLGQAEAALEQGFWGLFLDTLNIELTFPEEVPDLLALVSALRDSTARGRPVPPYLLANRGFGLLPRLTDLVDGVLFESFSVRWTEDGYAAWPPDVLEVHAQYAERLLRHPVELYALDYADDPELARSALRRAHQFGMPGFVSDRALSLV